MDDKYEIPPLQLIVTTYELIGNRWRATVSHIFHADTQKELFKLLEAHKITDSFFRASECGLTICEFSRKGGVIYLKNSEPNVLYP